MSIIQKFRNLFKTPWYKQDEWAKVDEWTVSYTKEKHDCPSWDIGFCNIELYKHKDRCEKRLKTGRKLTLFDKTVFDDPTEVEAECLSSTHKHISQVKLYDGPKYD